MSHSVLELAMKHLASRPCSARTLRALLEKDCPSLPDLEACIDATLKRLDELHLLNDNRSAELIAERYSHKGNRFIMQRLRREGFSADTIAAALNHVGDEAPRALDEARRKGRMLACASATEVEIRLVRFLSGRGFSHASINQVLQALRKELFFS